MWELKIIWLNDTCKRTNTRAQSVHEEREKKETEWSEGKKLQEEQKMEERRNR